MRATIIDADHDGFVVFQVGDLDPSTERQLPVGGGHCVLVKRFAAGGAFAMMFGAVIGGDSGFVITAGIDVVTGATGQ
ncbi:hypothetical protein D3C76_1694250 [compost metagenome]